MAHPQFEPQDVIDQVICIFAGANGFLDDVPLDGVQGFAKGLVEYFAGPGVAVREELAAANAFTDGLEEKFRTAIGKYKAGLGGGG